MDSVKIELQIKERYACTLAAVPHRCPMLKESCYRSLKLSYLNQSVLTFKQADLREEAMMKGAAQSSGGLVKATVLSKWPICLLLLQRERRDGRERC